MQAKQKIGPLQTAAVANIRRKIASFDVEQYTFRENFRKEAPFHSESVRPYSKLDEVSFFKFSIILQSISSILKRECDRAVNVILSEDGPKTLRNVSETA
jgi:hypothetical protein